MVSKTLASLDAWIVLAEEVLAEQGRHAKPAGETRESATETFTQLSFDLGDA